MDEIAPKLAGRTSGHLRIVKTPTRRGDNASLARISFVDDLKEAPVAKAKPAAKAIVADKKPVSTKAKAKNAATIPSPKTKEKI